MFLLDTNVVSELRKPRPHGAVVAWHENFGQYSTWVPCVVLYELQVGVELLRGRDVEKAAELEAWVNRIQATGSILNLDSASAREAARLMNGRSPELLEDAMIAAIAITNQLTVATRNVRDFDLFGVATVNPFTDLRQEGNEL